MEDDISIENALEMRQSRKNEGLMSVVVDESSKLSLCDDGEEHKEQVKDLLVVIEEAIKIPVENDGHVERFR